MVHRQMSVEGGFQGRTNKLVDGCYSYWMGALFVIMQAYLLDSDLMADQSCQSLMNPGKGAKDQVLMLMLSQAGLRVEVRALENVGGGVADN